MAIRKNWIRYILMPYIIMASIGGVILIYFLYEIPTSPTSMDRSRGLIYPFNNNGILHYIGLVDHILDIYLKFIIFTGVPLIFAYVIYSLSMRRGGA